jgi:hypothetical protein
MERAKTYRHIGIAQIYPWRPHGAQRDFLLRLAREAGYQTSELVCKGSVISCYDKQYQTLGWGGVEHCVKCRLGARVESRKTAKFALDWSLRERRVDGEEIAMLSNRAALTRAELTEDITHGKGAVGVLHAYRVGYHSALRWIEQSAIDLILIFNGRIDILKGVMDAARFAGIDFASYERSWFGNGIMLIPSENCLGLGLMHELGKAAGEKALSPDDFGSAESVVRRRVERVGSNEWRDFQLNAARSLDDVHTHLDRPHEILVLPSSMYEVWGHPDWNTGWRDNFEAIDWLQTKLGVPWSQWVVRGHPIWSQRVGRSLGRYASDRYRAFCQSHGIRYIEADSPLQTPALIDTSELVVINGGSSVIDAVWRGKPVISLSESAFRFSGICPTAMAPGDPIDLPDDATRRRQLIRFIHGMDRLMPTFVDHLVSVSSAAQLQYEGAAFQDIIDQVQLNSLIPPRKNQTKRGSLITQPAGLVERARTLFRVGDQ